MQILQVAGLYPPHLGGEELVVERLAGVQAQTDDVTVYTSDVGAGSAPRCHRSGRLTVCRDRGWRVGNTPVVPRLLARLLRHRPRPDIVHVHTGLAGVPELVGLATAIRDVPYVAHVHLLVRPSSPAGRWLLPAYQHTGFRLFLHRAARVICLTTAMATVICEEFGVPPERVAVVPNGVDLEVFGGPAEVTGPRRDLLFVGRLTAQKNVMMAVEAMARLPADTVLHVVGDGELADRTAARVAELGLSNVRLHGRLDPPALAEHYRRAAAVLMPSTHEGFPLVLLEAMAAGTPVVCSALPELIDAGGGAIVAVREPTPGRLAAAVRQLSGDPRRWAQLSTAARRRAAAMSWPATAEAVSAIYAQVLDGRVGRRRTDRADRADPPGQGAPAVLP